MSLEIIILAAGKGTRMVSSLPKVMHEIAAQPMLLHVLNTARLLEPTRIHLVVGHGAQVVSERFAADDIVLVHQHEQRGTGHAVMSAIEGVTPSADALVLYGDVPLISQATLSNLLIAPGALRVLTALADDPTGLGRILRDEQGQITGIVEQADANAEQRQINEINAGFMACEAATMQRLLAGLNDDNAQGELYLTDIVGLARAGELSVASHTTSDMAEVSGVNNRRQLAELERRYQQLRVDELMAAGVTLRDPSRVDVRGKLEMGQDCDVDINVIFKGHCKIGERVKIGANCILEDAVIAADSVLYPNSMVEKSQIGEGCEIGPYARIRPDSSIGNGAKVGNFVELKKTQLGEKSKANHLSYIGDCTVGKDVNIGAGVITCNYDGANKHQTLIGDGAFIGSDVQLIAPVAVGEGATVGAGTTISKDVPAEQLAISRPKQRHIEGWQRPVKKPR